MRKGHRVNKPFRSVILLAACVPCLHASVNGTVVNRTTGKPQAGVNVMLVKPGQQGMQTLGTATTDASGHFVFENDQPGGGPQLLQATYKEVNYNKLLTPNVPTSNVELDVYEATQSPAVASITQRMIVLSPTSSQVGVEETVFVRNQTNTTYSNPDLGGLRFYLPPAANGQVRVNVQGPQGMPLPRAAEKTAEKDVFKVNFPIKPGDTEFEVSYVLPVGSPFTFRGRVVSVKGMPAGPLRLVAPAGVTLSGNDIQQIGTEPKTQATIYNVTAPADFAVDIAGTGSLGGENTNSEDDSDSPQVREAPPRVYTHLGWLVLLGFSVLAVGLVILFRSSPVRSPYGK